MEGFKMEKETTNNPSKGYEMTPEEKKALENIQIAAAQFDLEKKGYKGTEDEAKKLLGLKKKAEQFERDRLQEEIAKQF